ncbi:MAG: metallophosphoesterase family protein [Candidatus Krumholzibacteriia bacterium]
MKLALISDIHGNLEALRAVLADIDAAGVDALACLGDIVGYGADPAACLDLVRSRNPVAVVQGNHDSYAADEREIVGFNPLAYQATLWTRGQLSPEQRQWLAAMPLQVSLSDQVTLVHASSLDPQNWDYVRFLQDGVMALADQVTRYCFFGHTHVPMGFRRIGDSVEQFTETLYDTSVGDRWLVNVGSVGQPRDGNWRAAWTLLDEEAERIALHRVEYDLETCMGKIIEAGLPPRLAERLALGR